MNRKVYIETSVISYLTARPSKNVIEPGRVRIAHHKPAAEWVSWTPFKVRDAHPTIAW